MNEKNNQIVAVIPVRSGSVRIKDKNFLPFRETSLLLEKIKTLKKIPWIDDICVSTNSKRAIDIATDYGCIIHPRHEYFCDEERSNFSEVVVNIASFLNQEYLLWSSCVSPCISVDTYIDAWSLFQGVVDSRVDSVISVEEIREYFLYQGQPLNFNVGAGHVRTQKLAPVAKITGGIYFAKRADIIKWRYLFGGSVAYLPLSFPETIDINNESDYRLAVLADHYWDRLKGFS